MLQNSMRIINWNQRIIHLMILKRSFHQLKLQQSHQAYAKLMTIKIRGIKTTNNKKDESHTEIYNPHYMNEKPKGPETAKEFADVNSQKNWISFGFDLVDQKEDRILANAHFFTAFTLGVILFLWVLYYYPYIDGYDWAMREAFLELDRRERLGLPLIDPNIVDPEKITLPSDEELGNFEIHL